MRTLGSELYADNHGRKEAERVKDEGPPPRVRFPNPDPHIDEEQARSFTELAEQLETKAKNYAKFVNPLDDNEVNYGLLETFARECAERIRTILGQ